MLMMMKSMIAATVLLAAALPAGAQGIDPADVTFWQSIQASQDPAEYAAYLMAFPKGTFAELARLRIQQLGAPGAAAPAAAPGADAAAPAAPGAAPADAAIPAAPADIAAAPAAGGALSDAVISISPAAPRVGDKLKVTFADMPNPSDYDTVVVVPAGSPDSTGMKNTQEAIEWTYIANAQYLESGWNIGPIAPGAYEVRWLTTLYNNESRLEVGARAPFEVSR